MPLGSAGQYGLLSGGTLAARNQISTLPNELVASAGSSTVDIPIRVLGKAGAAQAIGSLVTATQGVSASGSGTVPQALADLQTAKNYCAGLLGSPLPAQLAGQTLTQGVYTLNNGDEATNSDATLSAGSPLTISGDTTTVVVLNIVGNLTLAAGSQVVLQGVLPRHVYWNIGGVLSVGGGVSFMGVALVSGPALVDGTHFGACTILSSDDIMLTHISETVGHSRFFAPAGTDNTCAGDNSQCVFTRPTNELVRDGSLEVARCFPQGFSGLNTQIRNMYVGSDACFWLSATNGSADYYHTNGVALFSVPVNFFCSASQPVPALAQNSPNLNGQAYAGTYAYYGTGSLNSDYKEYIGQKLSGVTLTPDHRYYGEFSAYIAPKSDFTVPLLGMALTNSFLPITSIPSDGAGTLPFIPVVSGSPNLSLRPGQPANTPVTPGWQRVGQVFKVSSPMPEPSLVVGNFNGNVKMQNGPNTSGTASIAYYYLDNISLSLLTEAGPDVVLNTTCAASVTLGTAPMPEVVQATYAWTTVAGSLVSTQPNPTVSPTATTIYWLAVTINGQVYTSQTTVTVVNYSQNAAATYVAPAGQAAYELGKPFKQPWVQNYTDYSQTFTVIDASQAPYGAATNNTVTFDGSYHVKGNLRLTNGTFILKPGTTFYVDGYGHSTGDAERNVIDVDNGALYLNGATLRATCDEMWGGLEANEHGSIYAASGGGQRTIIRDAQAGLSRLADESSPYSPIAQDSHLYIADTDLLNNDVAVLDGLRIATYPQPDYFHNCSFRTDQTASPLSLESYTAGDISGPYGRGQYGCIGITFFDYQEHYNGSGSTTATPLQITNCTFDRLQVGIFGTSTNVLIQGNTFSNCWYAAAYSQFYTYTSYNQGPNSPTTPPVVNFKGNTITIPAVLPAGYSTTPNLPAYGVRAYEGFRITGNQFGTATTGAGVASQPIGVSLATSGTVGGSTDTDSNTLQGLDTGIEAQSGSTVLPTNYTFNKNLFAGNLKGVVFEPNPVTYDYGFTPPLDIALRCNTFSSNMPYAIGVQVQQNTRFVTSLGSLGMPNGNNFAGLGSNQDYYFEYVGSNKIRYYSYQSNQEYNNSPSGNNILVVITNVNGAGACGGNGNGVNIKAAQPASESAVASEPANRSAGPSVANLSSSPSRLNETVEQRQSQVYEQVLQHQRVAPAHRWPTLAEADRQALRQIAASGSLTTHSACQLLRFYEPNCQCVPPSTAAIRPAATATQLAARTELLPSLGEGHPNPASETVTLSYHLPAGAQAARLVLRDLTGRQVLTQILNGQEGAAVLAVQQLATGLYVSTLEVDGRLIGTRKLAIMR